MAEKTLTTVQGVLQDALRLSEAERRELIKQLVDTPRPCRARDAKAKTEPSRVTGVGQRNLARYRRPRIY